MPRDIWKLTCLYTLDPGSINAQWHLILTFTRCRTRMAPDTPVVSNEEAVIHGVYAEGIYIKVALHAMYL